jgi:hypothetical protein
MVLLGFIPASKVAFRRVARRVVNQFCFYDGDFQSEGNPNAETPRCKVSSMLTAEADLDEFFSQAHPLCLQRAGRKPARKKVRHE